MKFSIKDFFGKCYQIRMFKMSPVDLVTLLKKSLMENFIFCAVIAIFDELDSCNQKLFVDIILNLQSP